MRATLFGAGLFALVSMTPVHSFRAPGQHGSALAHRPAPHWSWIAPSRPAIPDVKQSAWIRNPIDSFTLAKMEARGLSPAPEADRRG